MTRLLVFALLIVPLWGVLHWYLGKRLLTDAHAPTPVRIFGWSLIGLNATLVLFVSVFRRMNRNVELYEPLIWLSYVGLGAFALMIVLVLLRDIPLGLYILSQKLLKKKKPTKPDDSPGLSRRELFTSVSSAGIAAVGIAGTARGYHNATKIPDVQRVNVPVKGLPSELVGLKIVQISDVHVGNTITPKFLEDVVARVNTLNADIVAITGDLVDGYPSSMLAGVSSIGKIKARYGTFFVTGNHEYYWDGPGWVEAVKSLGVHTLVNEHKTIVHNGKKVVVAGVTDYSAARMVPEHTSDPIKALKNAPEDAAFKLLLAHQPKSVYLAAEAGADLQLSGHTHGGQFYPWNFVVGMVHPFSRGLHPFKSMQIYVSCGTGFWGPPMRLGAPSEITLLELAST